MLPAREAAALYQTDFVRNARAVGALWAGCTLCFGILEVVVLIQPTWVQTASLTYELPPSGILSDPSVSAVGSFGLYQVCTERDNVLQCEGSLVTLTPIPSFKAAAVFVLMALVLVMGSVASLGLFWFCSPGTVYKVAAWQQLSAGERGRDPSWGAKGDVFWHRTGGCSNLPGPWLPGFPRWLGSARSEGSLWPAGEELHPGCLQHTLGLHPGIAWHCRCPGPSHACFCAGKPAGCAATRRLCTTPGGERCCLSIESRLIVEIRLFMGLLPSGTFTCQTRPCSCCHNKYIFWIILLAFVLLIKSRKSFNMLRSIFCSCFNMLCRKVSFLFIPGRDVF
uniref:LHFPL tetraspan subfamily member 4 n=1 Tax=Anolis carolinensis TaxID=28377 RepID=G1KKQ0_ANOCA